MSSGKKFRYPCKHVFGVFNFFGNERDFESLLSHHSDSVFATLDTGHLRVASKIDDAESNNSYVDIRDL